MRKVSGNTNKQRQRVT